MTTEILDLELIIQEELMENENDNCIVCNYCVPRGSIAPGTLTEALCGRVDTYKLHRIYRGHNMCPDCEAVEVCSRCGREA